MRLEDQVPLNLEEAFEVTRLRDVAIGLRNLGCIGWQFAQNVVGDSSGRVPKQLGGRWIRDIVSLSAIIRLGLILKSVVNLILQVLANSW